MKDDGTTAGGCWIYTGVYADEVNQAKRRKHTVRSRTGSARVGLGVAGRPPHSLQPRLCRPRRQAVERAQGLVWWDADAGRSGPATTYPTSSRPRRRPTAAPDGATGHATPSTVDEPFIMQADGKGWLFTPTGVVDGPLPTHYEPHESPVRNPLYPTSRPTLAVRGLPARGQPAATRRRRAPGSEVFPYVFTTYRLTEHHTAGGMSRWLPLPVGAAAGVLLRGQRPSTPGSAAWTHLGWATIVTARAAIEARVSWSPTGWCRCASPAGRTLHQVGLPYHWGVGGTGCADQRATPPTTCSAS